MNLHIVPLNALALEEQKLMEKVQIKDTQKFFRGQRVRLLGDTRTDEEKAEDAKNGTFYLPSYSLYLATKHDCIIHGSYFELCNHQSGPHQSAFNEYSIIVLSNPMNSIAWIHESVIELISDDRLEGERLIREYKKQNWRIT